MNATEPIRRPPPDFRIGAVVAAEPVTPRLRRVTLAGEALVGFPVPEPAASLRLLLPEPAGLVLPTWTGNEFLLPDGRRPVLRTFTPVAVDPTAGRITIDVVLHGAGPAADWAAHARPGDPVAVSGPGRGWTPPPGARSFVLGGDESAVPALRQVLAALPADATASVVVEVDHPDARHDLGAPDARIEWLVRPADANRGDALVAAITAHPDAPDTAWWVAGEAATVQRIRVALFRERGVDRARASVRGYWKRGAAGDAD